MFSLNNIFNYPISFSIVSPDEEPEYFEELKCLLSLQTIEENLTTLISWINENKHFVSNHLSEINQYFLEKKLNVQWVEEDKNSSHKTAILLSLIEKLRILCCSEAEKNSLNEWMLEFIYLFDSDLRSLPSSQLLFLIFLMQEAGFNQFQWQLFRIPPYLLSFQQLLKQRNDYTFVDFLKSLPQDLETQSSAIGCYMNFHKISIRHFSDLLLEINKKEWIPYLTYLDFRGVENISLIHLFLNESPCIRFLFLENDHLEELPFLGDCRELHLNCPSLKKLPSNLSQCRKLILNECNNLESIPDLPKCTFFSCKNSKNIQFVSSILSNCTYFQCIKSGSRIKSLPSLPKVSTFIGIAFSNLRKLPSDMSHCEVFKSSYCKKLKLLPKKLPSCKRFKLNECPKVRRLPLLPSWRLNGKKKLKVEQENLFYRPTHIIQELAFPFLRQRESFPFIQYVQKGELSEGFDAGGLKRDLVTRLCIHLFKNSLDPSSFLWEQEGFPLSNGTRTMEKAYQVLGVLFAFCYPKKSLLKTGPLPLKEEVYDLIASPYQSEIPSPQWWITSLLKLHHAPSGIFFIADPSSEIPSLSRQDLEYLSCYLDEESSETIDQNDLLKKEKRERIYSKIFSKAKKNLQLKAISSIARGMWLYSTPKNWEKIKNKKEGILKKRIEGEISKEKLIESLCFNNCSEIEEEKYLKTKNYVNTWIQQATSEDLVFFLRAITSNSVIVDQKIQIMVYERDLEFIPCARTCSFTIELSANYPSQKHFNEKLQLLMSTVSEISGSGFQFT